MADESNDDPFDGGESIAERISKLSHLFAGKSRNVQIDGKSLVGQEGLLDALFVLYDECKSDALMRNLYIAAFVKKCKYIWNQIFLMWPLRKKKYQNCCQL